MRHRLDRILGLLIQICAILERLPNSLFGHRNTGKHLAPESLLTKQLRDAFDDLNRKDQQKVVNYAEGLAQVPRYAEAAADRRGAQDAFDAENNLSASVA